MPGAGNPSPVWEKGRDEDVPYPQKAQRLRIDLAISGSPSPLPLSHPGEGIPRILRLPLHLDVSGPTAPAPSRRA